MSLSLFDLTRNPLSNEDLKNANQVYLRADTMYRRPANKTGTTLKARRSSGGGRIAGDGRGWYVLLNLPEFTHTDFFLRLIPTSSSPRHPLPNGAFKILGLRSNKGKGPILRPQDVSSSPEQEQEVTAVGGL